MSLQRVLEPEAMETEKDAIEYDGMDFTETNTSFAVRALELAPASGRILDLGTGTARIPILMLERDTRDLFIHALDLSKAMLNVARKNIETARMNHRVSLEVADAKNPPVQDRSYDMVISNSLAHHIPNPSALFKTVVRTAKPRAGLLIRDLLRPDSVADANYLVEKYAGDVDEYQRKLYRDSLFAALTIPEVTEFLKDAGIMDAEVVQSSDRHWSVERAWKG